MEEKVYTKYLIKYSTSASVDSFLRRMKINPDDMIGIQLMLELLHKYADERSKEAVRQVVKIVLSEVAEKAEIYYVPSFGNLPEESRIDRDAILNLEHSEELLKKLGIEK